MKTIVADASVVLRWFLADETGSAASREVLESFVHGDVRLVAPSLLDYEVLNGLLLAARRSRLEPETAIEAFRGFRALGIEPIEVREFGEDVLLLAAETGLTVYDACYPAAAKKAGAELMTADRRLHDAVKRIVPSSLVR